MVRLATHSRTYRYRVGNPYSINFVGQLLSLIVVNVLADGYSSFKVPGTCPAKKSNEPWAACKESQTTRGTVCPYLGPTYFPGRFVGPPALDRHDYIELCPRKHCNVRNVL
jgi:hypothetical protein